MRIIRSVINSPSVQDFKARHADGQPISITHEDPRWGNPRTVSLVITGHEITGDGQYRFSGHTADTGTSVSLSCWDYGLGADTTLELNDGREPDVDDCSQATSV